MSIAGLIANKGTSIVLQRPTETTGTLGQRTRTFAAVGTYTGWIQPIRYETMTPDMRREINITHNIFFAEDPGAQEGDRFLYDSRYFFVRNIKDAATLNRLWRYECEEKD